MLLRDDGPRLRFLGPAADDTALDIRNTGNRRWMRFELRSDASTEPIVYPLLVERRDVLDPIRTSDAARSFGPTTPTITLDPPGAMSVDPVDLAAFATERLKGRYHWLRDDGGALLYVCAEHKVTWGGPEIVEVMEPLFEYCDADVRVRLHLSYGVGSLFNRYR